MRIFLLPIAVTVDPFVLFLNSRIGNKWRKRQKRERERVNAQTIQRTQTQREREGQNGGNTKLNQQQVC